MSLHWPRSLSLTGGRVAGEPRAAGDRLVPTFLYPPADPGLQLLDAAAILAGNEDLLRRLRLHAALPEAGFEQRFALPLRRLADHINVLPASASALFSGPMGLFRAALECAFYAYQASDGRIFTAAQGVERRHALEDRWRYLCFAAGLLYPLGKPLERLVVSGADGSVWPRHLQGLTAWAAAVKVERVYVSWGNSTDDAGLGPGAAGVALLHPVLGAANLQHLEDGAADLVSSLYQLVAGARGSARIAQQLVSACWDRIQQREAARRPQAYGRLVAGTHQAPYLVGAIRTLVQEGRWSLNRSCLRADRDGLYLQWPQAAGDLMAFGRERGYPGWPQDPATLAALLVAAGIVQERCSDLAMLEIVDGEGEIHAALKFTEPLGIVDDFDPRAYAGSDGVARSTGVAAAAPPTPHASGAAPGATIPAAAPQEPHKPRTASPVTPPAVGEVQQEDATEPVTGGRLVEAPDQSFAQLVPPDLRQEIGNPLQVELLGKVVHGCKQQGDPSAWMRRLDHGCAIALSFLAQNIRDVPTWVDAMAKVGLIYAPPQTPGLRIHKVHIPAGGNPVQAVILTGLACRRLQL